MKKTHVLGAIIVTLIGCWILCEHLHDTKYDDYKSKQQTEYIRESISNGSLMLEVSIDETETEYHHLGQDISIEHTCNGKTVHSGDIIAMKKRLEFNTIITEHDNSADDVGEGGTVIGLTSDGKGYARTTITVKERGGRKYKNAYATWNISYSVTPDLSGMEKIGYWEVIFS